MKQILQAITTVSDQLNMYKITDITRANVNNKKVKIFTVFKLVDHAYIFLGRFTANVKTANKNLLEVFLSK
jgi:hypothetical protein